jgi:hypothetical protein
MNIVLSAHQRWVSIVAAPCAVSRSSAVKGWISGHATLFSITQGHIAARRRAGTPDALDSMVTPDLRPHIGEILPKGFALMAAKGSVRTIVDAEMVHPAFAEGLQSVLTKLDRFALK